MTPEEWDKIIVSIYAGGLGNRLKSWVSTMRLVPDARVHWKVNKFMPAAFSQLFANDCGIDSIPPGSETHDSWRLAALPEDKPHLPAGFSTAGAGAHPIIRGIGKGWWVLRGRPNDRYRYMMFPKTYKRSGTNADARYIDFEYERIPEYFREIYCPLFQQIIVRPEIMQRVNDWASANLDENVIGVHVRSWRDAPHRNRKYHKSSMKRLSRLMNGTNGRFLVVTDSDEVIPALKDEYGNDRIIHFTRETTRLDSWKTPTGITEDLVDMLLLSRTQRLFASYLSTFSEVAWWLGGATGKVWVF